MNSKNDTDTATKDAPTNAPEEKPLVDIKKDTGLGSAPEEKKALLNSKNDTDTATKDATNVPTEAMERHERAVKIPLDGVKNMIEFDSVSNYEYHF